MLLGPVLRDVERCSPLQVRVERAEEPRGWDRGQAEDLLYVWTPDGSGVGIWTASGLPDHERLAVAADRVHEAVVEGLWSAGRSTSWPPCPRHPERHPLQVTLHGTEVVWACPGNGEVVCRSGS